MWHAQPVPDGQPGWKTDNGLWLDTDSFAVLLDEAHMVTFHSPTGAVIPPD